MNNDPCGLVGKADAVNSKVQSSIPGECQKLRFWDSPGFELCTLLEIFSQVC